MEQAVDSLYIAERCNDNRNPNSVFKNGVDDYYTTLDEINVPITVSGRVTAGYEVVIDTNGKLL